MYEEGLLKVAVMTPQHSMKTMENVIRVVHSDHICQISVTIVTASSV
jgi:hypothetical protein